jgi:hypothetical protein
LKSVRQSGQVLFLLDANHLFCIRSAGNNQ